jgi:hypothetical protein
MDEKTGENYRTIPFIENNLPRCKWMLQMHDSQRRLFSEHEIVRLLWSTASSMQNVIL